MQLRATPLAHRSAGALGCHTRIRAGFPRDRSMARDRPSPYVKGRRFFTGAWGARMPHAHPSEFPPHASHNTLAYRSAGACPPRSPSARGRFRSFRTYMSIEKRVVPFSRSFRSLIKTRAALAKTIKDLKDLSVLRDRDAIDIQVLKDLKRTRDVFSGARTLARETRSHASHNTLAYRSAGACPPRSQHGEGQALALRQGTAFFP